ncbi:YSIRK-type signal peptide-containing protein [Streptococcus sp. X13SY08]|uniref:YSIRK-type signal peptide-containing protein n=1 Tax=Streptococcus sp. X13SY08 TaxID=1676616 RepID=UPI0009EBB0AF|nr:YSIRK-type signal peptide-containing protein [Streptococcus sp. X13SY08]
MKKEKTMKYYLRKSAFGLVAVAAAFILNSTTGSVAHAGALTPIDGPGTHIKSG